MIDRKSGKNKRGGKSRLNLRLRNFRIYLFKTVCAMKILIVLFVPLFLPLASHSQHDSFFEVRTLIKDMQRRFKLNSRDLRRISPLIKQENKNVINIYARFGGREPEYSDTFWQEIIEQRVNFENRLSSNLTKRQNAALRTARAALEQRILDFLLVDYVYFLGDVLELNSFEVEALQIIFGAEHKKIHQLIIKHSSRPALLRTEMKKISEDTERRLEKALTPEKLRDYRSLSLPPETFIA